MNNSEIIKAWKNPEYRANLTEEQRTMLGENPIGNPEENFDLSSIRGGRQYPDPGSAGWVCTISGECNGGQCCNPFTSR